MHNYTDEQGLLRFVMYRLFFQPICKPGMARKEAYREKGIATAAAATPLVASVEFAVGVGV